ncbi:hypothetical protein WH91_18695 [Devosia psychrophila]|uniref:Uncharacterized protein n=1 Tax=Devosia psychrophila TaxID=728005 RepID=A0ABR5DU80_9HYPH|nr:hypothetical protein [Devosia psychrophila]KKC31576.1 hypothetical protein WH91_18695 [Devosia psychrophila]
MSTFFEMLKHQIRRGHPIVFEEELGDQGVLPAAFKPTWRIKHLLVLRQAPRSVHLARPVDQQAVVRTFQHGQVEAASDFEDLDRRNSATSAFEEFFLFDERHFDRRPV